MQNSRHRLLQMFRKVETIDSSWRILIMGDLTVKTVSYSLKKSEAHDQHVSDFENLYKIRAPYPSLSAIYFIQPTEEIVNRFLLDMAGKSPLYRNSRLSKELRNRIKSCATLKGRLGQNLSVKTCLVEHAHMNLEYLVIDGPGFVTHNDGALEELLGNEENTCKGIACLNVMAARIATVFVSLKIAGELCKIIVKSGLQELGQLEQDLVFGDAGIEDVIKYLESKEDATREHKLRLLMIVAAIYPEVCEGETGYNLMKLAKLQPSDMKAVNNMRLLGGHSSDTQKSLLSPTFSKSDIHAELVEKLSKDELLKDRLSVYWSLERFQETKTAANVGLASGTRYDFLKGPRIFVFVAGGATRTELRVCHKLTTKLKGQVVLGSSSLDDPATLITKLKLLKGHEDGADCWTSD